MLSVCARQFSSGTHKPAEALDRLLKHSGLVFTDDRDGYVVTRWTR